MNKNAVRFAMILSVVLLLGLSASPAFAVAGIANAVRSELSALVAPAIGLGVIWMGLLILSEQMTVLSFLTFAIGTAIVLAGGFL